MPRPPHINPSLDAVKGSVYSALAHRLAQHSGPVYPLHVGDTWLEPAEACRLEQFDVVSHPGMHRYTQVQVPPKTKVQVPPQRPRSRCRCIPGTQAQVPRMPRHWCPFAPRFSSRCLHFPLSG